MAKLLIEKSVLLTTVLTIAGTVASNLKKIEKTLMTKDYYKPLSVNLTGEIRHQYDENSSLPIHELIIRPLLENSINTFVYKGTTEEFFLYGKKQIPIKLENIDILIKNRHKFKFDKSKECILGNEYLWNAKSWKRGSIVMVIEYEQIDFAMQAQQ